MGGGGGGGDDSEDAGIEPRKKGATTAFGLSEPL
jgi:hypothetical protein